MKTIILLSFCICVVYCGVLSTYPSKYDNVNLDHILGSRRLVGNYVECLMDKKPCTTDGADLKKYLPDALKTRCAKCTAKQKEGAKKVMTVVQRDYPDQWQLLLKKWDLKRIETFV